VLVTTHEESQLTALAQEHKVTVPRLLVEAALAARGETATQRAQVLSELFRVRRALAQVAVELTAWHRTDAQAGCIPVGIAGAEPLWSIEDEVAAALARLDEVLDRLAGGPQPAGRARALPGTEERAER
jgi:hypothetical protein